jgi:hypothetical protein
LVVVEEGEEGGITTAAGLFSIVAAGAAGKGVAAIGDLPKIGGPETATESVLAAPPPKLKV